MINYHKDKKSPTEVRQREYWPMPTKVAGHFLGLLFFAFTSLSQPRMIPQPKPGPEPLPAEPPRMIEGPKAGLFDFQP